MATTENGLVYEGKCEYITANNHFSHDGRRWKKFANKHHAHHEADKVVYEGIDHKSSDIFRLANQMRKENVNVVGDKPVKNEDIAQETGVSKDYHRMEKEITKQ